MIPEPLPPTTLPIIDLSPFHSPIPTPPTPLQSKISRSLTTYCKTLGFFYITNHNIPPSLIHTLQIHAHTFFSQTPSIKSQYSIQGNNGRGYQKLQENVTGGRGDFHEGLDFMRELDDKDVKGCDGEGVRMLGSGRNVWGGVHGMKGVLERYVEEVRRVGRIVLGVVELGLGLRRGCLMGLVEDGFWILRLIRYPGGDGGGGGEGVGCGLHRDYGLLTVVLQDECRGCLKVLKGDGGWVVAEPVEGCLVVNVGDCLERVTGGLLRSTPHMVERPIGRERLSIPCFVEPRFGARLQSFEGETEGKGDGDPLQGFETYGEYLYSKVSSNFVFDDNND